MFVSGETRRLMMSLTGTRRRFWRARFFWIRNYSASSFAAASVLSDKFGGLAGNAAEDAFCESQRRSVRTTNKISVRGCR